MEAKEVAAGASVVSGEENAAAAEERKLQQELARVAADQKLKGGDAFLDGRGGLGNPAAKDRRCPLRHRPNIREPRIVRPVCALSVAAVVRAIPGENVPACLRPFINP